ncbi:MAG: Crp/Fnr family transcriptional regulator [Bacteroidota bacterium]
MSVIFLFSFVFTPHFRIDQREDTFSEALLNALEKVGTPRTVQRSTHVLSPTTANDFFFYIRRGIFKTVRQVNDRPVILGFTFPGDVDADITSLIGQTNSEFSIVAVTDADVLLCTWRVLEQALSREKYLATINHFLARYVTVLQNRIVEALAVTAEERYKQLVRQQAQHLNEIPISDMASYLGITKQSMSRIRSSRL